MFRPMPLLICAVILGLAPAYAANTAETEAAGAQEFAQLLDVLGLEKKAIHADESRTGQPASALLVAITRWLAANFDLPAAPDQPRVALVSADEINRRRYGVFTDGKGGAEPGASQSAPTPGGGREVVAIYSDADRTIYLPHDWAGHTPSGVSVLVHEMVHHLQKAAGLTYPCAGAREKLAYAAQDKWLRLFGRDLATEFDIDGFTLMATTSCL